MVRKFPSFCSEWKKRSTFESTPQFPNGISAKLPYHLTSNRNFRIFWPNGMHPLCPQQMFPSLRSMETQHSFCIPRVFAPEKHHEQQCVRKNVFSSARALRKRKRVPFYRVIQTRVEVWENEKCCGNTSRR